LEECKGVGTLDDLKLIGFDCGNDTCIFFRDCFTLSYATKDPHYLLEYIQLSRSQVLKLVSRKYQWSLMEFKYILYMCSQSYCSSVKMCAAENCTYTVSTKQRVNRCQDHPKISFLQTGPCSCYIAYFYPSDATNDGRHWFVAINAEIILQEACTMTCHHQNGKTASKNEQ